MDWDREVLELLQNGGAGWDSDLLPWQPLRDRYLSLAPAAAANLAAVLVGMISLDYRNPHSEPAAADLLPLPAGMQPGDLLCLEAAAYVCADLGLGSAGTRLQALLQDPRFHAVYPHLRTLYRDLPDLLRRLVPPRP